MDSCRGRNCPRFRLKTRCFTNHNRDGERRLAPSGHIETGVGTQSPCPLSRPGARDGNPAEAIGHASAAVLRGRTCSTLFEVARNGPAKSVMLVAGNGSFVHCIDLRDDLRDDLRHGPSGLLIDRRPRSCVGRCTWFRRQTWFLPLRVIVS